MSMQCVDFAFNFFKPKGEKKTRETQRSSVALR